MSISNTVSIMDINFFNITKSDFLHNHLYPHINQQQKCFIVTANPEIVMRTRENATYKKIVQSADYIVPDGAGIILAAKYMKKPLQERVAGFDLMMDLLDFANMQGLRVYFLGAKDHVNKKAIRNVEKKYPNLRVAGHRDGYFDIENPEIAEEVKRSSPDIILVALGLPRQEEWISKYIADFTKGIFLGVGGSFDVLAEEVKRAPQRWIDLNLEWLYRMLQQPFRLKRIFKVFEFMIRVVLKRD